MERNTNLELLRIVSIFLIVAHHYYYNIIQFSANTYEAHKNFIDCFASGGKIGVALFVMISGYFMVNSKITLKKLLSIMSPVWFYSYLFLFVYIVFVDANSMSLKILVKSLLPIATGHYWFITAYIFLMIFSPFFNKLIHSLRREQLRFALMTLFFIWCFLGTFLNLKIWYNDSVFFVFLYGVAAYIRLYVDVSSCSTLKLLTVCITSLFSIVLSVFMINYIGMLQANTAILQQSMYFSKLNSIFVVFFSYSVFVLMIKRPPIFIKWINNLASTVLGIYLIHGNLCISALIWECIINLIPQDNVFIHAFLCSFFICLVCAIIEWLRQLLFGKIERGGISIILEIKKIKKLQAYIN